MQTKYYFILYQRMISKGLTPLSDFLMIKIFTPGLWEYYIRNETCKF